MIPVGLLRMICYSLLKLKLFGMAHLELAREIERVFELTGFSLCSRD